MGEAFFSTISPQLANLVGVETEKCSVEQTPNKVRRGLIDVRNTQIAVRCACVKRRWKERESVCFAFKMRMGRC